MSVQLSRLFCRLCLCFGSKSVLLTTLCADFYEKMHPHKRDLEYIGQQLESLHLNQLKPVQKTVLANKWASDVKELLADAQKVQDEIEVIFLEAEEQFNEFIGSIPQDLLDKPLSQLGGDVIVETRDYQLSNGKVLSDVLWTGVHLPDSLSNEQSSKKKSCSFIVNKTSTAPFLAKEKTKVVAAKNDDVSTPSKSSHFAKGKSSSSKENLFRSHVLSASKPKNNASVMHNITNNLDDDVGASLISSDIIHSVTIADGMMQLKNKTRKLAPTDKIVLIPASSSGTPIALSKKDRSKLLSNLKR